MFFAAIQMNMCVCVAFNPIKIFVRKISISNKNKNSLHACGCVLNEHSEYSQSVRCHIWNNNSYGIHITGKKNIYEQQPYNCLAFQSDYWRVFCFPLFSYFLQEPLLLVERFRLPYSRGKKKQCETRSRISCHCNKIKRTIENFLREILVKHIFLLLFFVHSIPKKCAVRKVFYKTTINSTKEISFFDISFLFYVQWMSLV